jgi:diacylglycerol kinase family enzyme
VRRIVVIANSGATRAAAVQAIADAFARHGAAATVEAVPGGHVERAARAAVRSGADVVVAAGGDGTVSAVASVVAGTRVALGVVPLGRLNHFARDVGLPLDLDAAVGAVVEGEVVPCDVGSAGGRPFVNNATLGLYADQVRVRERWRKRLGRWLAAGLATAVVLRRVRALRLSIRADEEAIEVESPLVVVSNNEYALTAGHPHGRARLDSGRLGLYVLHDRGGRQVLTTAIRSFVAGLEDHEGLSARTAREVVVGARRRHVKVALDGEVRKMATPTRFRAHPGALRVVGARPDGTPEAR